MNDLIAVNTKNLLAGLCAIALEMSSMKEWISWGVGVYVGVSLAIYNIKRYQLTKLEVQEKELDNKLKKKQL